MEKTDVNQIYGDYYFSDDGEVIVGSNNFDVKGEVRQKKIIGSKFLSDPN